MCMLQSRLHAVYYVPALPVSRLHWRAVLRVAMRPTTRLMASHQAPPGSPHPIRIQPARPLYRFAATGLGAAMWFFLFYRAKKDGAALLGLKHPWDH